MLPLSCAGLRAAWVFFSQASTVTQLSSALQHGRATTQNTSGMVAVNGQSVYEFRVSWLKLRGHVCQSGIAQAPAAGVEGRRLCQLRLPVLKSKTRGRTANSLSSLRWMCSCLLS